MKAGVVLFERLAPFVALRWAEITESHTRPQALKARLGDAWRRWTPQKFCVPRLGVAGEFFPGRHGWLRSGAAISAGIFVCPDRGDPPLLHRSTDEP